MPTDSNEGQQELFDDNAGSASSDAGTTATDTKDDEAGEGADKGTQTDDKTDVGEGVKTGDKDAASGTPPEDADDPEAVTDEKGQKFIPEHRFKAALKKVTEERDAATSKVAEYEKPEPVQAPDKDTDPEGHDLHNRMEASKAVMMEMRPDYQEKINHFAKMAESNPLLNQAVAGHPIPAKLAYDIASKDLEITEALTVKGSDEWKEFQEYKKTKASTTAATKEADLGSAVANGLRSVPNLNRSTNASPNRNVRKASNGENDDDLFKGAL